VSDFADLPGYAALRRYLNSFRLSIINKDEDSYDRVLGYDFYRLQDSNDSGNEIKEENFKTVVATRQRLKAYYQKIKYKDFSRGTSGDEQFSKEIEYDLKLLQIDLRELDLMYKEELDRFGER
jgi:hypothetical protein